MIPNGVDAARFAAARPLRPSPWGPYVLAVGGIEPRKGSLELLEAMARVRRDVRLVIAGGETLFDYRSYRAEWEARAAALGLSPVVLGPVPDPELPALVAGASAFAFPSVQEGFGLAALEALAAGVPTVVSDLPVLREVFAGAVIFAGDLARSIEVAVDGGAPDPRIGRALAESYTWEAAAAAHLELYRRFASR